MIDEETLKYAFDRVKNDIFSLGNELSSLKNEFFELNQQIQAINESLNSLKLDILDLKNQENIEKTPKIGYYEPQEMPPENPTHNQTHKPQNPSNPAIPTHNPTDNWALEGLKYPDFHSSIGNRGVPTDRQTDQQTDNPTHNFNEIAENKPSMTENKQPVTENKPSMTQDIFKASEILASLDTIKRQIRLKFKQITTQEMLVFSTIYQLEELNSQETDYKNIAIKLNLSESSIRDYVQKLINKGIPIIKTKLNNKKIILSISSELKQLASLQTILKLREI